MRPPCASTRLRAIDRPSPLPRRARGPIEAVERMLDIVGRHPGTGVADSDRDRTVGREGGKHDPSTGGRESHGVREEVRHDLANARRVDRDRCQVRDLEVELHAGLIGGRTMARDDLRQQGLEVGRLAVEAECAGLGEGERPQIVDQARQDLGLVEDGPQVRLVGGIDAVEHPFQRSLHDGQRRAQLVADIGKEGASCLVVRGQARAHRVECPSQRADLRGPTLRDLRADLAGLDTARRLDEVPDRRAGAAEEPRDSTAGRGAMNGRTAVTSRASAPLSSRPPTSQATSAIRLPTRRMKKRNAQPKRHMKRRRA